MRRRWDRLTTVGRQALSYELIGIGGAMFDMTLDHVKTREQFGRPLGGFQAVKHKLADVRLWKECALLAAAAFDTVDFVVEMVRAGWTGHWGVEIIAADQRALPVEEAVERTARATLDVLAQAEKKLN